MSPAAHTLPLPTNLIFYPILCLLPCILLLCLPHTLLTGLHPAPRSHPPLPYPTSLYLPPHHKTHTPAPPLHPASCKHLPLLHALCLFLACCAQPHGPERVGFSNLGKMHQLQGRLLPSDEEDRDKVAERSIPDLSLNRFVEVPTIFTTLLYL